MGNASHIAAGQAALQAGKWAEARLAFETALLEGEAADALAGLGDALWWLGEPGRSLDACERAYAAFRQTQELERAASMALNIGLSYTAHFGNTAVSNGWIARAERLLEETDASPVAGWLQLVRAYITKDAERARALAEHALETARGSGDVDLELCALARLGEVLVSMARFGEGLSLVDEAMAGAFAGERRSFDTVVFTSCSMISACELAADVQRAIQWGRVTEEFTQDYGCPYLYAKCRAGFGHLLIEAGRWTDAERELKAAVEAARDAFPTVKCAAFAWLADLRLRQGDLEDAAELLSGVDYEPTYMAVLARLQLARGEAEVAVSLLQRRIDALPGHCVERTDTLGLLVEGHLARGDADAAAAAASALDELAREHDLELLNARAAQAHARVLTGQEAAPAAVQHFERALRGYTRLQLPLEAAIARLELAQALATLQPAVAAKEGREALAAFEHLGAAACADAAAAFLRSLGIAPRIGPKNMGVLTQRERQVLRLLGRGLSNPEIARQLSIRRKTASNHVSNVLGKLGLRNRAEAAAFVTRTTASRDSK